MVDRIDGAGLDERWDGIRREAYHLYLGSAL